MLENLSYIDALHNVQLKGRVACEINTCDELILTELIFENVFASLGMYNLQYIVINIFNLACIYMSESEEIVSLLSALVFQVYLPVYILSKL